MQTMKKSSLIFQFRENYSAFISFINSLSKENYNLNVNGKWSAGEHLAHLVLSVKPIVDALQMDKKLLASKFGSSEKLMRSYDDMKAFYLKQLAAGGKAPKRFDPAHHTTENRTILCEKLTNLIEKMSLVIEAFSEEELDDLALPHPLLGNLSLREMLYNSIYHSLHHQNLAVNALKSPKE